MIRRNVWLVLAAAGCVLSGCRHLADRSGRTPELANLPRPQVVGFTFQGGYSFAQMPGEAELAAFNAGGLDGFGLSYVPASSYELGPEISELQDEIAFLRDRVQPGKHVWPVMFIVRILEPNLEHSNWMPRDRSAVAGIRGIDLDNEAGARAVLETNWRRSLQLAQALGSPGIMFDPEWYTNGTIQDVAVLAERRGEDIAVTIAKCEALGARLADITAETYPGAAVFWFYTGLHKPEAEWSSVARICLGAAKRCAAAGYRQLHIDGGENGVGYLHRSVDALRARVHNRWVETAPLLREYPNFELGGVLAPYVDSRERVPWMTFDRIGTEQTAADFQPHFEVLFRNYRFVWLYGTHSGGQTGFNPWEMQHALAMAASLNAARVATDWDPPARNRLPVETVTEGGGFDSLDYDRVEKQVWVDLAAPGSARIEPRYGRGAAVDPNAATGAGARVIPELVEAGGRVWPAQIEFDGSKVTHWPWPAVTVSNLPQEDISGCRGTAFEVYNPNDQTLYVRFALFTHGAFPSDQWGCLNADVPAHTSYLFSFDRVTKPIQSVSIALVKQPEPLLRLYVSPLMLVEP